MGVYLGWFGGVAQRLRETAPRRASARSIRSFDCGSPRDRHHQRSNRYKIPLSAGT
jgi:hypothetical protein